MLLLLANNIGAFIDDKPANKRNANNNNNNNSQNDSTNGTNFKLTVKCKYKLIYNPTVWMLWLCKQLHFQSYEPQSCVMQMPVILQCTFVVLLPLLYLKNFWFVVTLNLFEMTRKNGWRVSSWFVAYKFTYWQKSPLHAERWRQQHHMKPTNSMIVIIFTQET